MLAIDVSHMSVVCGVLCRVTYAHALLSVVLNGGHDARHSPVQVPGMLKMRSRLRARGRGAQWREMNGLGALWVPQGEDYRVVYMNEMGQETTLHQHGLTPPLGQDGVPWLAQMPLPPRRSAMTHFSLARHNQGTYFAHSHFHLQHALGLSLPLIVEGPPPTGCDAQWRQAPVARHTVHAASSACAVDVATCTRGGCGVCCSDCRHAVHHGLR